MSSHEPANAPMNEDALAAALVALGCPPAQSIDLARQLDKRARQLAKIKGRTYEDALKHLLSLMRQGWAAKGKL